MAEIQLKDKEKMCSKLNQLLKIKDNEILELREKTKGDKQRSLKNLLLAEKKKMKEKESIFEEKEKVYNNVISDFKLKTANLSQMNDSYVGIIAQKDERISVLERDLEFYKNKANNGLAEELKKSRMKSAKLEENIAEFKFVFENLFEEYQKVRRELEKLTENLN